MRGKKFSATPSHASLFAAPLNRVAAGGMCLNHAEDAARKILCDTVESYRIFFLKWGRGTYLGNPRRCAWTAQQSLRWMLPVLLLSPPHLLWIHSSAQRAQPSAMLRIRTWTHSFLPMIDRLHKPKPWGGCWSLPSSDRSRWRPGLRAIHASRL